MRPSATSARSTRGERIIVGVNDYVSGRGPAIPILEMDPQGYERQVARLQPGAGRAR